MGSSVCTSASAGVGMKPPLWPWKNTDRQPRPSWCHSDCSDQFNYDGATPVMCEGPPPSRPSPSRPSPSRPPLSRPSRSRFFRFCSRRASSSSFSACSCGVFCSFFFCAPPCRMSTCCVIADSSSKDSRCRCSFGLLDIVAVRRLSSFLQFLPAHGRNVKPFSAGVPRVQV